MDSAKFARWVDAEIAKRGLKKQDFYKGSGISSATLSQWRTGLYTPSRSAIEKVEQFFDVTFDVNLDVLREEAKKDAPLSEASRIELAVLFEEACAKKGITPAFACQRAGVNGGFVTRLRTWKAAPISREELMALASFLDCADDVREILGEIEKEPTVLTDDKLNEFIQLFEAASPRLQEIALEILKVGESSRISQDASLKDR